MSRIDPFNAPEAELNWSKSDIEQKFGFHGGRFTTPNNVLTFLLGCIITVLFFVLLVYVAKPIPALASYTNMFLERGVIPYATLLLFFWSMMILFIKGRKLALQRKALKIQAVPVDPDFILNRETANEVLVRLRGITDDTSKFLLLNRVDRAFSNIQNIGQIADVSDILRTQTAYDEEQLASGYSLLNGFVWAIPVLGFIGTVLGLSHAIGAFGATLRAGSDLAGLRSSLETVAGGLGLGFDTTLIALVCTLIIQLLLTFMQNKESAFLDECNEYCHAHIISKLKLI